MPLELELIYRILNSFIMNDLVEGGKLPKLAY